MAWVAVTKQDGRKDTFTDISLCSGSIKKLIGRELSWSDEDVKLK